MKRIVIILDAVRRDEAKDILYPFFSKEYQSRNQGEHYAKFHEIQSIDTYTKDVFKKIHKWVNNYNGWRGVINGGGYAGEYFQNWNVDYYDEKDSSPVKNYKKTFNIVEGESSLNIETKDKDNCLLLLHDYWVHNYFDEYDLCTLEVRLHKKVRDMVMLARKKRILEMVKPIIEIKKMFKGWELYLTADHGDEFWDTTDRIGHDNCNSPAVMDNWVIDFQHKDKIDSQKQLFIGK